MEKQHEAAYGEFTEEDYREVVVNLPGSSSAPFGAGGVIVAVIVVFMLVAFLVTVLL